MDAMRPTVWIACLLLLGLAGCRNGAPPQTTGEKHPAPPPEPGRIELLAGGLGDRTDLLNADSSSIDPIKVG